MSSVERTVLDRGLRRGHRRRDPEPRPGAIWPRIEAELDDKRKALGVEDELREVEGVTTAMMVALGENDIKSVEDLAGCATDDLVGWTERKDGETTRHSGYLDGFDLSRQDAEAIVMAARVKAGWVEAPEPEAETEAEAEESQA
jgi:N utilization substance protein A